MARAALIPGLDGDLPFGIAAARVVAVRTRELLEQSRGVLDESDPERLHDMRVAARRLRTALDFFAVCFPPEVHKPISKEVKQIASALGDRRDDDVMLGSLTRFRTSLVTSDLTGFDEFAEDVRGHQREMNTRLSEFVDPARLAELGDRIDAMVGAAVDTVELLEEEDDGVPGGTGLE